MKSSTILLLGGLILGFASTAIGGNTCSHRIIIKVIKRNEIVLGKSGNALHWTTDKQAKKITVGVNSASRKLAIQVQTTDRSSDRTFHRILPTDLDKDFITAISKMTGQCNMKYSFLNNGNNNKKDEIPQVTYTITDIF